MVSILLLPLLGTVLGSSMVFFLRKPIPEKLEKLLLGFASGVMIAASVWSLLIPCMEMSQDLGKMSWLPAVIGFMMGIFFLLLLDSMIPHMHMHGEKPEGIKAKLSRSAMLIFAVTLHNFPEGMAVGVGMAGVEAGLSQMAALALSIGIAIQNFPEGAIISMPLRNEGMSRSKAFLCGALSGIVEPIGAVLIMLLAGILTPTLPYFLSFAAGAMIYVVVEELIPEAHNGEHSNIGTIGVAFGFSLMMILDVALA